MKSILNMIIPVVGVLSFFSVPVFLIVWIWTKEDWAWQVTLTSLISFILLVFLDTLDQNGTDKPLNHE